MCLLYVLWVFGVKTWAHGLYLSACAWQVVEHTLTASSIKTEGLTQHCGTNKYHPTTVSSPHFSPTLIWPLFFMCSTQSCISTLQQRDQTLQEVDAFKVSWNNDCKPSSNFPFYLLLHSTTDVCTSFPHIKTGNALAWHQCSVTGLCRKLWTCFIFIYDNDTHKQKIFPEWSRLRVPLVGFHNLFIQPFCYFVFCFTFKLNLSNPIMLLFLTILKVMRRP